MRGYGADDIVTLPRLSTAAAVALGQELITAAKSKIALPRLVESKFALLKDAHAELHHALSQQKQIDLDPKRAQVADVAEDCAWSAFHDWLVGWSKLGIAEAEEARTMYAVLFPTRLKFSQIPYKLEWAEADARLARIAKDGFAGKIEQLGGRRILDHLIRTHRAYGEALGIAAEGQGTTTCGLHEPLSLFLARLRAYVLTVAAHADDADPESSALAESLLAPLRQWQSRSAAAEEPDEPVPPTVPTPTNGTASAGVVA